MYCALCRKIGQDFNERRCDCGIPLSNCTLIKTEDDSFLKLSSKVCFIKYDENGRGKELLNKPEFGTSLLMSPFNEAFTWLTTAIEEIIEEKYINGVNYLKFRTMNSLYELYYTNFSDIMIKTYDIKK